MTPNSPFLFPPSEIPTIEVPREKNFKSLVCPLWTENKARLIQEYIRLFTFITKHGAYIDGFAAPQRRNHPNNCSARLVLQNQPQWVRKFWLCDIDPEGVAILNDLKDEFLDKKRRIEVLEGDFNISIDKILDSGDITEKVATFALLDQRTFECRWSTVQKIADHKKGTKIEIFYFFATGWIDRSIAAIKNPETAHDAMQWWGREDWRSLLGINNVERANMIARRFKDELGYKWAYPYAIHNAVQGGRTMYHMIHATDHDEASPLMLRAYRKVSGRGDWDREVTQHDLEMLWSA